MIASGDGPFSRIEWRGCTIGCLAFVCATLAIGLCKASAGERHALIIAVNEYAALPKSSWLSGPANDATLIVGLLTGTPAFGFARENITVLANGTAATDGPPDRNRIRAELDRLAGAARPGDIVYVHFSGHGSTQKARDPGSEPDGLDEVFLPADTLMPANGIYPNALVDDEIGAHLDHIRNAGAQVFVVFDACNSASATRAFGQQETTTTRWLPSATAGLPDGDAPLEAATTERLAPIGAGEVALAPGAGAMVAFFAAQTTEVTPEMMLPKNGPNKRKLGLFTHTIFDVLARSPALTYRELADGVMHAYAVGNRARPTPLFEGELDRPVFGVEDASGVLQWPLLAGPSGARIPAGSLHGLSIGSKLALLGDPLDAIGKALGYAEVVDLDPFSARLRPVAHAGLASPSLATAPPGTVARPVDMAFDFELTVAMPDAAATRHTDAAVETRQVLEALATNGTLPANIRTVDSIEEADLRLVVMSRAELYPEGIVDDGPRLWFLSPDGRLPADERMAPHSITLAGGLAGEALEQARENLAAVFRATSVSRLAAISALGSDRIGIDFSLQRGGAGVLEPMDGVRSPLVAAGDRIHVAIANGREGAVDVDILLVGPSYSIQHLLGRRFLKEEKIAGAIAAISPSAFGTRRLLLIAREAMAGTDYRDLAFLEQVGTQTRASPPGGARDFAQLIDDIARGPNRRSAARIPSAKAPKGLLQIYSFESVPR